jgi:hypothetical protein
LASLRSTTWLELEREAGAKVARPAHPITGLIAIAALHASDVPPQNGHGRADTMVPTAVSARAQLAHDPSVPPSFASVTS